MQIIENWSEVSGTITSIQKSQKIEAYLELGVNIHAIKDIKGFKNLLVDFKAKSLTIFVRESKVPNIKSLLNKRVQFLVRKANLTSYFMDEKSLKEIR
jgi:hypothetical protein